MHNSTLKQGSTRTLAIRRPLLARLVLLGSALVGLVLVAHPTEVLAHAQVVGTAPSNGSVVPSAPPIVSVSFNEPVTTSASKVQLLSSAGSVIPANFMPSADKSSYTLTPKKKLTPGLYVLRYSVLSADGHTVAGASSFLVGPRPAGKPVSVVLSDTSSSQTLVFSSSRPGPVTTKTPPATVAVEFRHKRLGATLQAQVAGTTASAVLPFAGEWNVTLVLKASAFTESRLTGRLVLR